MRSENSNSNSWIQFSVIYRISLLGEGVLQKVQSTFSQPCQQNVLEISLQFTPWTTQGKIKKKKKKKQSLKKEKIHKCISMRNF